MLSAYKMSSKVEQIVHRRWIVRNRCACAVDLNCLITRSLTLVG